MSANFIKTDFPGLVVIQPKIFRDERGYFLEVFSEIEFSKAEIREHFVQDNQSHSIKGVLRGLHYQTDPMAQGKLIRCIKGEIYDVAVDLRIGSPTYLKHFCITLSEINQTQVYIPSGFAHGFCTLSDTATIVYKVTKPYSPKHEKGIIWNDPKLNIEWPISSPILSEKDSRLPLIDQTEHRFEYSQQLIAV